MDAGQRFDGIKYVCCSDSKAFRNACDSLHRRHEESREIEDAYTHNERQMRTQPTRKREQRCRDW